MTFLPFYPLSSQPVFPVWLVHDDSMVIAHYWGSEHFARDTSLKMVGIYLRPSIEGEFAQPGIVPHTCITAVCYVHPKFVFWGGLCYQPEEEVRQLGFCWFPIADQVLEELQQQRRAVYRQLIEGGQLQP